MSEAKARLSRPGPPLRYDPATLKTVLKYALLLLLMLVLAGATARAEETVVARNARGEKVRLTGEILRWDGDGLRLRTSDGREQLIAPEHVLGVETEYTTEQVQADRARDEGRPSAALPLYEKALSLERRRWARRRIVREMVRCHRALGQVEQAGELFLLLARDGPGTDDLACAPLAWSPSMPSPTLARAAGRWMNRDDLPAAALLGASRLLSTDRAAAKAKLKQLMVEADGPVARLAGAQLWRTEIVTAGPAQTEAWQRAIAGLPEPLRAGPWFVLGRALARQGKLDEAALAMLRAPILYPGDRELAAAALVEAGRVLEKLGRAEQAGRVYREVTGEHANSSVAEEARQRLEALGGGK